MYRHSATIFLPSHQACKRTPRTSRLVPSHCATRGVRGEYTQYQWPKRLDFQDELTKCSAARMQILYVTDHTNPAKCQCLRSILMIKNI